MLMKRIIPLAVFLLFANWCLSQVTLPYSENFDTFPVDNISFGPGAEPNPFPNNWDNVQADAANQDWYGRSVATGSSGTGPTADHTSGSGVYLFIEDGWGNNTDISLETPQVDLTTIGSAELSYWANSYTGASSNFNEMHLDVFFNGAWVNDIDVFDDLTTGNTWVLRTVDISAYTGGIVRFRFRGDNSGQSFQHDIAIDDFSIIETVLTATINNSANNPCFNDSVGYAVVDVSFGTTPYTYAWSNGGTTDSIGGLQAGTYTVTVTDQTGTTSTASVTITEAPDIGGTVSIVDNLCFGDTIGSITIDSISGATPIIAACGPATGFTCSGPASTGVSGTGTSTNSTTGYPAPFGNWYWGARHQLIYTAAELNAMGLNGATMITSLGFDISQINGTANYVGWTIKMGCTSSPDLASGWETGLTTVLNPTAHTVTVGVNSFTFNTPYLWDGVSNLVVETCFNNSGFTNNSAHPYTTTSFTSVRYYRADISTVCTNTSSTTGTSSNRPNTTFGFCSVSTDPYTYSWSTGSTAGGITGLGGGTYTLTITDGAGCTFTPSFPVAEPTAVDGGGVATDVLCFGDSTGTITMNATGGTAGAGGPGLLITEVDPGSPDFIEIANVTGQPFDATGWFVATSNSYTAINTANTMTWNLTGTVPAGWVDYREDATGTNYWGNNLFYNSGSPGWVAIIDNNGNVADFMAWGWTAADIATMAPVVNGVTITPGAGWTGNAINSTCANTFTRTGNSDNNDASDWICAPATKGTANTGLILPIGGSTYTYAWSNGNTTASDSTLTPGTYTVTVTDANGCTDVETFTITEPSSAVSVTATSTDALCNGDATGTGSATAAGGTPGYTFLWSSGDTLSYDSTLMAGTYTVIATDSNGCTAEDTITVNEPTALSISTSSSDITCNGAMDGTATVTATGGTPTYAYAWSNGGMTDSVSGLDSGMVSIMVTDANGCTASGSVSITQPAAIVLSIDAQINNTCNGDSAGSVTASGVGGTMPYVYAWSNGSTSTMASNLPAGMATLTVTDANGCTETISATIGEPAAITIAATGTDVTCSGGNDGGVAASASGGVGGFTFLWSTTDTDSTVSGLMEGTYTVTVTDGNGCEEEMTVTVGATNQSPTPSLGPALDTICEGNAYILDPGSYTSYDWSDGSSDPTLSVTAAGTYTVTVTDANGCTGETSIDLVVDPCVGLPFWVSQVDIKYFPNPTDGLINMNIAGLEGNDVQITVLTVEGRIVHNESIQNLGTNHLHQVDLQSQAQGIYFIKLTTAGQSFVSKISVK